MPFPPRQVHATGREQRVDQRVDPERGDADQECRRCQKASHADHPITVQYRYTDTHLENHHECTECPWRQSGHGHARVPVPLPRGLSGQFVEQGLRNDGDQTVDDDTHHREEDPDDPSAPPLAAANTIPAAPRRTIPRSKSYPSRNILTGGSGSFPCASRWPTATRPHQPST